MIIENPDIFKSWLTSILEPLCDADPAALAKYVYALVKKDKPVEELREVMVDQLDVFLQAETKPFVEMLFTSLESNEYLNQREAEKPPTPPPEPVEMDKVEMESDIPATTNGTAAESPRPAGVPPPPAPPGAAPRPRLVVSRAPGGRPAPAPAPAPPRAPPVEQTLVKVLPLTELLEEPVDQPPRRRDRRNESVREALERRRRRSRSPRGRARRAAREHAHAHDDARRRLSRSPSPRRYRNRSPPPPAPDRSSRSRSPVAREHERDRARAPRELERDRMSRDRDHRDRLSRSRDRDRSRERSRDRSRGSISPRPENRLEHNDIYKRRCRDFDEKGYCMRGDQCQWDHGNDPVVLEDNALTRVLTMPPPVPEYNPLVPDIWMGAPPGFAPFPPPHLPPPRELIHIPRVRHEAGGAPGAPPPRHPAPPHKKNFDYTRLGKGPQRPPPPGGAVNCSLEVKKVPRGLNDITHLNNHFCKFGKIVNIQICYEGDPEAALITFSTPTEANVAYKSTEAVLNNRFIKVFWHNPDNKQENMAPGGAHAHKPAPERGAAHPMSHNKVLINRDNMKATHDIKQNNIEKEKEKQTTNGQEPKKETPKPAPAPADKSKRGRELLETQLLQQRRLIQKLEEGNLTEPQKAVIMDAIKSTQEGIEKLRKELVSYQGTINMKMQEDTVARMSRLQLNQVKAKKPKTREEAQKEILDAELDMFTKQQEGQDVTELMTKIVELRRQLVVQFPVHTATIRRPHSRGGKFNTATRYTRGAISKIFPGSQSVDHRPRALLISGFETDELEALYTHFSQFGEVSSKEVELSVPQLVLQYKARAHAEQAMLHGKHYNDRTLSITWASNPSKAAAGASNSAERPAQNGDLSGDEHKDEPPAPAGADADALLRFEEEDEDEREDRSWRR